MAVSSLLPLSGLGVGTAADGLTGKGITAHVGADGEGTPQPGFPKSRIKNISKQASVCQGQ